MKKHVAHKAPKRVKYIEFGVSSASDIRKSSEIQINHRDLYYSDTRDPVKNGVLDRRLSCCRVMLNETERISFIKRLRTVGIDNLRTQQIIKSVTATCKKVTYCMHCKGTNGVVKKAGPLKIVHEKFRQKRTAIEQSEFINKLETAVKDSPELKSVVRKAQEELTPLRVFQLFQRIPDEDCELMGLDKNNGRPEQLLWTAIPVPPCCIRPSVAQDDKSNEDDLTVKLTEIIFINSLIESGINKGASVGNIMEQWDFLSLAVAMYISSEVPGVPAQISGKPIRGFTQRLKGKQGRFRGNLSGKRVDFSGRTVISPDPNMGIDEVAIPELVAKVLTFPEVVTSFNINKLRKLVINGPLKHPGANYVQKLADNGMKRFLKFGNRRDIANELVVGDIVERHLDDGDIVLFNRQPSLHRLSIMSHRARVKPWRTFRFNECVCTPYNADFDGDEMNIHLPQTQEARAEATILMGVKNNLVTPRNGEPIIGATQDFITTSFLITQKDKFYTRAEVTQIISYCFDANVHIDIPGPCILRPMCLWSGKQIINLLMKPNHNSPVSVSLETKTKSFSKPPPGSNRAPDLCPNDGYLVIKNSEIMCGALDKSIVGDGKKKSIFFVVLHDYGTKEAAEIMNRLAKLSARWSCNQGFSIGISDVTPGEILRNKKDIIIEAAYKKTDELIRDSSLGKLECLPGCDDEQTLESHLSGILSRVRDDAGNICMQELGRHNAPLIMATCGSKGSIINVCQMVASVGQQIVSGSRIGDGFTDRSLPHFPKFSKTPAAKGFVRNSFYTGLSPPEFLFHAVSGRVGLVDTAVKTAETGYMQRRLMKALEDLSINYDTSVRNSTNGIVQFVYGDDGLDPSELEGEGYPVEFNSNWSHIEQTIQIDSSNPQSLSPFLIKKMCIDVTSLDKFSKNCTKSWLDSLYLFCDNLASKLAKLRTVFDLPSYIEAPDLLNTDDESFGYLEFLDNDADYASRKTVNNILQVTKKRLVKFFESCLHKYLKSKIEPGTAVGALGAQSIGEPGTQMTLKTFHFAGVASMNVTLGVPRIKEIINAASNISTPIITAKLVSNNNLQSARIVKGRVESCLLGDIAECIEEVYRPSQCYLGIKIDLKTLEKLQLELTLDQIASAIARCKLKIEDRNVRIYYPDRLRVFVVKKDKELLHYNMQNYKRFLPKVVVNGYPQIVRSVISDSGKGTYDLLVEGYGLKDVMNTDGVIGTKTTSNHVMEMQKVLGIEAARQTIINEIQYTMESHGMSIDPRHMMLLGDVMTYKGEVLGITRFGIAKMKDSVMMLASFEKTTDHLFDAAIYGKRDAVEGVSERIIMGTQMNIGTGMFKLLVDDDVSPNSQFSTSNPSKIFEIDTEGNRDNVNILVSASSADLTSEISKDMIEYNLDSLQKEHVSRKPQLPPSSGGNIKFKPRPLLFDLDDHYSSVSVN
ncbi:DNA-directed RNA polymerase III subunit rpc1 [Smittium culicis]|uniref:DNA-directed RNA polymerase subunit n=2 Tax=Smittium culicis TaxID=133412 RepID=A0A1R1X1Z9_9FUNG|nr:DNA-directed RNA polymerase III subunit rpc1 [Smittium culicis]